MSAEDTVAALGNPSAIEDGDDPTIDIAIVIHSLIDVISALDQEVSRQQAIIDRLKDQGTEAADKDELDHIN